MDKVFVDTSFFIALLNSRDADHPHAVQLQEELASLKARKTTSEFILLELCDGLAKLSHRELAIRVVELLQRDGLFASNFSKTSGNLLYVAKLFACWRTSSDNG